ncbi:MAG: tRNA (guanosine(37)-N1)-methyltransferase TrmD [Minisyncoccales bacterium]
MIRFEILTIFPKIFDSFLKESLIKKAIEKKLIKINVWNLRDFTKDKHKKVDDKVYGGGRGMVFKIEPIFEALKYLVKFKIKKEGIFSREKKSKIILFSPRGKMFNEKMAFELSRLKRIILICGRYEGVDERVKKYLVDLTLSIGPYDLMGGEVPAMVLIEAVSRLIKGVVGKEDFLKTRALKKTFLEYPQYTKPSVFQPKKGIFWSVPKVLLSGHHQRIADWRKKYQKKIGQN